MVSLSVEQGQGGYFFDHQDSISNVHQNMQPDHDDLSHDASSLHERLVTTGPRFHRLSTAWVAVFLFILFIGYLVATFVVQSADVSWFKGEQPLFSFFLVIHVALWLVVFLSDRYLQHAHHVSQALGYLQMFRDTKEIRRLPYNVLNLGNAILLVIATVLRRQDSWSGLHLITILQIVFILELAIVLPGITWYLIKVIKFNKKKPQPDAEDKEFLNGFTATAAVSQSVSETGFRDGEYLDEVLEKQADMIRYLQQHNANLGSRLMHLMQQQSERPPNQETPA